MKRWLLEPMLHFILAGLVLFALHSWLNRGNDDTRTHVIRISAEEIDWLRETWTRQWHRAPDKGELRTLISDYLKEGLLAREARELGMDENDTIIRRRLAQKMEFLMQNTARLADPDEAQLRRLYRAGLARYQRPARISFIQVYFKTESAAWQAQKQSETPALEPVGEATLLEPAFRAVDLEALTNLFGKEFADSIFGCEIGRWTGPLRSAYGFHLVRIDEYEKPRQRAFSEVRAEVLENWHRKQQEKAYADYLAGLFEKYQVIVEGNGSPTLGPFMEASR